MSSRIRSSLPFYYTGTLLLGAMILGGGTDQGLWTDHLLAIAMLPAMWIGFGRLFSNRLDHWSRALVVLMVLLLLMPFVPVFRTINLPNGSTSIDGLALLSLAPQKSLEAALFALPVLGFFLYVASSPVSDQERALRFVIVGFTANLAAGIVQLSYGQQGVISNVLPFEIHVGLFENRNHFSSAIYATIPILAYLYIAKSRRTPVFGAMAILIVGFLFAVGSRAGMVIVSLLAVLSLGWFATPGLSPRLKALCTAATILIAAVLAHAAGLGSELENDGRSIIFETTWRAIRDYWPWGSGLGTFVMIYPAFEAREVVAYYYINHAHNDYLEIILELGAPGLLGIVAFSALIVANFSKSELSQAAFLSVTAIMIHSLVDYPLRTMAIAVPFAYLSAIILSVRADPVADAEDHSSHRRVRRRKKLPS